MGRWDGLNKYVIRRGFAIPFCFVIVGFYYLLTTPYLEDLTIYSGEIQKVYLYSREIKLINEDSRFFFTTSF